MFLGDVSTTSTNIYFVLGLLNASIFSFQVHATEFILFTLFFGDIASICTTGWAICSPILVQLPWNLQGMLQRCVSTTSTRIFSIRMFKVKILHFCYQKNIKRLSHWEYFSWGWAWGLYLWNKIGCIGIETYFIKI